MGGRPLSALHPVMMCMTQFLCQRHPAMKTSASAGQTVSDDAPSPGTVTSRLIVNDCRRLGHVTDTHL